MPHGSGAKVSHKQLPRVMSTTTTKQSYSYHPERRTGRLYSARLFTRPLAFSVHYIVISAHFRVTCLSKMCHLYKIVHGFVDFPNAPLLFKPCTNYYTRHAHHLTLLQPQTHSNAFYFSFFSHAVSIWNSLPYTILSSPSINTFKRNFMIHCYSIV